MMMHYAIALLCCSPLEKITACPDMMANMKNKGIFML